MLELSKEDKLKYRLYNLCNYIRCLNIIHFLLFIYNFGLSLQKNDFENIFFNCLHLFLITPIMYFSVKNYIMYFIIISEVYKICFIIYKLFYFYSFYTFIEIFIINIDIYIIYFNLKFIHFNYNASKEIIISLSDGWKPINKILYLY